MLKCEHRTKLNALSAENKPLVMPVAEHREELLENWNLARQQKQLNNIKPLE